MRAPRQFRPTATAGALACTLLVAVTACSSTDKPAAPRPAPSSAAKSGTDRVPLADCQKVPPDGRVYRSGLDLKFDRGSMLVALPKNRDARPATTTAPAPATPPPQTTWAPPPNVLPPNVLPSNVVPPNQAPPPQYPPAPQYPSYPPARHHGPLRVAPVTRAPAAPATHAPSAPANPADECVSLHKWGNASPEVPPDGLLFTFRGAGSDGGQITFPAVALTGGVVPLPGPDHPRVGPLVESIPVDIGISLGGKYYLATGCPLKIVAMSPKRAAGHFVCPTTIPMRENPLAPNDAAPNPDDEGDDGPTPAPPAQPAPVPPWPGEPGHQPAPARSDAIRISGWFEAKP